MKFFIKFADTLSTSMGKAFSWCIVILMGGTVYEVVMAYVFNAPTLWNFDFSMQMYGAILMMSGAYCLATEAHVRGDVIYRLFSQRTQAWIDLVLYFLFFFPGVIALAFYGYEYAALAWKIKETSWSSPAQIQIYMVKSMIPAAGVLLIIQGISEVFRSIICIQTGKWPARLVVAEETEQVLMRAAQEEDKKMLFSLTNPEIAIFMMGIFLFAVLLGFPIAFTLMAMGIGFGYYAYYDATMMEHIFDNRIFQLFVQNTYTVMDNNVLTAVPLFLFMGYLVERAGIVAKLFFAIRLAAHRLPASMAVAALITCTLFSTATGIIGAVVTLMGLLAWPAMVKAGYDKKFASGIICAGGCLGILIPPSIMLIVYSVIAQLSPLRLFAAAIFPGLMLAGLYIAYAVTRAWLNPSIAPKPLAEDIPPRAEILKEVLVSFVPLFGLIMLVLGTILAGIATPAEAAAAGAFGAILLSWFYKTLKWQSFKESVFLTAKTTAMIMWLFIGSWTFSSVFSYLGGHEVFEHFFTSINITTWQFLIITQIIIFLLGWPLEWTEILIIFVPIFLPLLEVFDVNPYFFAMLIALNLQTSFLTPPMAMSAYYLKGVQKNNVELMQIFAGIMPFLGIVIFAMFLMYMFPGIALWLPETLFAD
ncbi:TRAP transporter large permease subunit [Candidatus Pelagibacter sp.]|nr:TRAP transporter large permease subunit [Candidatus Pelagibacter sp.]